MLKLRYYYHKYFSARYFNKLLLIHFAITAAVFLLLGNFIVRSVNETLVDKEIQYADVVLRNMSDYLDNQLELIKIVLQQTYLDANAREDVFYFLENDLTSLEYLETKPVFDNFFFSQYSRSKDIVNLYVHKIRDDLIYQYAKSTIADHYPAGQYAHAELLIPAGDKRAGPVLHAAYRPKLYGGQPAGPAYPVSIPIKRRNTSETIGTLIVDLDPRGFADVLDRLDPNIAGQFLVLLDGDRVVFDSTGEYSAGVYPYAGLLDRPTVSIAGRDSIVNRYEAGHPGVTFAAVIPKADILRSTETIGKTIVLLTLLSILACLLLIPLASNAFSNKIKALVSAMKAMRGGDLSVRIPVRKASDEIDQIALGFNKMTEELSGHIERVYISEIERQHAELSVKQLELRQKSIELSALQARINPHFLYNTLEVIRMKAQASREPDIADMIYVLADLFRSSVSAKYAVTVEEELENAERYMKLFGIRCGGRLAYETQVEAAALRLGVVKLVLQPILENYTLHGYRHGASDNRILLTGRLDGARVLLEVRDNGKGIPPERLASVRERLNGGEPEGDGGIGLSNVAGRLHIVFGDEAFLQLDSVPGEGTTVMLGLPQMTPKELREHVENLDRGR